MARMTFGPWVRLSQLHDYAPNEFCDVCLDAVARPEWIGPESNVKQARWLPSPAKWATATGEVVYPHWIRRRNWSEPLDIDVSGAGHRESIDLELCQDGSAVIRMHKGSDGVVGEITIPAADLDTVAQWFTKAVEANKQ